MHSRKTRIRNQTTPSSKKTKNKKKENRDKYKSVYPNKVDESIAIESDINIKGTSQWEESITLNEESVRIQIEWRNIQFYDGALTILNQSNISKYLDLRCREIYNLIIPFFDRNNIVPPYFTIKNNIIQLIEINQFFKLLDLGLEIMPFIDFTFDKIDRSISSEYMSHKDFARIVDSIRDNHNEHIQYLSSIQSVNHKIIVVDENSGAVKLENREPGFVFTFTNKKTSYLVWESTIISKATYIFKLEIDSYEDSKDALIAYIKSNILFKRDRLSKTNDKYGRILGFANKLIHRDYRMWETSLKSIFGLK